MTDEEKRRQRRELRFLQQQSVWLQKVLFALRKVEDTRDRIADLNDEDAAAWVLAVNGEDVAIADLEDALEDRVKELLTDIRERRGRAR